MKDQSKPRRPIDIKRDSAVSFSISEPDGKIEEVLVIDDKMVIVSTKGVHQSELADEVDPDRTDFNLPQTIQQKIIGYGSETPFIAQTLVMARELFDNTHLGENFDRNRALSLTLRAAHEFAAAADILASFEADQVVGIEELSTAVQGSSLNLPTMPNLRSRASSYLNHLRSVSLSLVGIVGLFFPKAKRNEGWREAFDRGMQEFLSRQPKFGETANYLCEFIESISHMRNALEHPDKSKGATITDFRAVPGGLVRKPRLIITFEEKKLVDSDIDYFMKLFLEKAGETFEDMCALLCDANIVPFEPLETRVVTDQPDGSSGPRRYRYVSHFKEGFEPKPE